MWAVGPTNECGDGGCDFLYRCMWDRCEEVLGSGVSEDIDCLQAHIDEHFSSLSISDPIGQ